MKSDDNSGSCEASHESKFRLVRSEGRKGGHCRLQRLYWRPLIVSISPSSSCSATGIEVREEQPDSSHNAHPILPQPLRVQSAREGEADSRGPRHRLCHSTRGQHSAVHSSLEPRERFCTLGHRRRCNEIGHRIPDQKAGREQC